MEARHCEPAAQQSMVGKHGGRRVRPRSACQRRSGRKACAPCHRVPRPGCLPPTAVAKLCQQVGVAHVINNAYGVQSAELCAQVRVAGSACMPMRTCSPRWLAIGRFPFNRLVLHPWLSGRPARQATCLSAFMLQISSAWRKGRVDAVVQSTGRCRASGGQARCCIVKWRWMAGWVECGLWGCATE